MRCYRCFPIVLVMMILFGGSSVWAETKTEAQVAPVIDYTALITKLALLIDHADQCGQLLNYYGKEGLTTRECKAFKSGFYKEWQDRDSLRTLLADEFEAVEQGRRVCDEDCRVQLQRIEELRVTVTYYLDYMDFVTEMEME